MKKILSLLLMAIVMLHASDHPSGSGGKLLDFYQSWKPYIDARRNISKNVGPFTLGNYTLYDAKLGKIYYPKGWKMGRFYIPAGVSASSVLFSTKPNTNLRVHLTFVGSNESAVPVIDHDGARRASGTWNMQGTVELRSGQNAEAITFDVKQIQAKGGGWLYWDVVEDIASPESVAQPEQYGYTATSNPSVTATIYYKFPSFSVLDPWIAKTNFLNGSGDPSEANTGSIKIIDRPSATQRPKVRYTSPSVGFQRYDSMADYLAGGGSQGGGSSSSSVSSSSVSSSSSSSVASSSSSSYDNGGVCAPDEHLTDFGCEKNNPQSSSSVVYSSSSSSSSVYYSSSSSSVGNGGGICGPNEHLTDFGCESDNPVPVPVVSSSSLSSRVSSSSAASSSSVAAVTTVFEVKEKASLSKSETDAIADKLAGRTFALHGSILKNEYGTVIYITDAKKAYIYKGVTQGNVVWSKDIAPEFLTLTKIGGTYVFGPLMEDEDKIVGPETDLEYSAVPIIGKVVHYERADKSAWLAIDTDSGVLYALKLIDGEPYKIKLFDASSSLMKGMRIDDSAGTVTFGGLKPASTPEASSSSSVSSVSTDPVEECKQKGGSWSDDFGCSI